jgi:hypothetical protein
MLGHLTNIAAHGAELVRERSENILMSSLYSGRAK